MNYRQNDRISQVQENSVVIGIDIASETHYARAFDWRGVELGKVISFENRLEGFSKLKLWIQTLQKKHAKDKVLLGAEPTGHYWFALADFLKGNEMKLVPVNPYHAKKSKEPDDNHPTKNDLKDPKTIARLVIEGRYMEPYIPKGIYADLRVSVYNRQRIIKEMNGIKNRIERWLKIYFPEFKDAFPDPCGKGSMMVLHEVPLPEEVLALGVDGINRIWREAKLRAVGIKQAKRLYEAATGSIGRKEGGRMARMELMMMLDDYDRKNAQLDVLYTMIEELCMQIPEVKKILAIKGIGLATIAGFFAEVGDIRRFDPPKQIRKLAALDAQGAH